MSRAEVRGIFISASDYTEPAIHTAREFLQHKTLVLVTLQEIVRLLEQQDDLAEFVTKKVQAAQIHKNRIFDRMIRRPDAGHNGDQLGGHEVKALVALTTVANVAQVLDGPPFPTIFQSDCSAYICKSSEVIERADTN